LQAAVVLNAVFTEQADDDGVFLFGGTWVFEKGIETFEDTSG